ncbi:MAG: GspE/PulE family protein [Candidatus Pacebacteria bacterium]|nr:GspE/PulE family protein [Candidatus Paceibacterota bacterium]
MPKEEIVGEIELPSEQFSLWQKSITSISGFAEEVRGNLAGQEQITATVQLILAGGVILNSSDIHLEPEEEKTKLRVRLDGILHDTAFVEPALYGKLLSRVKLLAGLKLNITDRSQDGRFTLRITNGANKNIEIEVRVSVLPSEYGEAIVMRILNPQSLLSINDLGIREDLKIIFEKEFSRPNGMIIITGPTGSGKTTTLYAILKKLQSPEIKIITIEDPIEYHLSGISQSQVNQESGYTFVSGLQAIVRQDPDVILVGEIRDSETAQIAIQAALTGHLVLSTLHTNDAAGTIARMAALGEKPAEVAPALNAVVAQRLVRVACRYCREMVDITENERAEIKKSLANLPATAKKTIKIEDLLKVGKISRAKGCPKCNSTGYKGRIGLYEIFIVDDEMENFIAAAPSVADLNRKARDKGMTTMRQDGLIKVLQGITTLDEIERVAGE